MTGPPARTRSTGSRWTGRATSTSRVPAGSGSLGPRAATSERSSARAPAQLRLGRRGRQHLYLCARPGLYRDPAGDPGHPSPRPSHEPIVVRLDPRLDALIPADARVEIGRRRHPMGGGAAVGSARERAAVLGRPAQRRLSLEGARRGHRGARAPAATPARAVHSGPTSRGRTGSTFDAQGRLVLCQHGDRRIARREADGQPCRARRPLRRQRLNSPNDLVYGPDGALYFTDPPFGLPRGFDDPGQGARLPGRLPPRRRRRRSCRSSRICTRRTGSPSRPTGRRSTSATPSARTRCGWRTR